MFTMNTPSTLPAEIAVTPLLIALGIIEVADAYLAVLGRAGISVPKRRRP